MSFPEIHVHFGVNSFKYLKLGTGFLVMGEVADYGTP